MEQVLVTRCFAGRRVERFLFWEQVLGEAWRQIERCLAVWARRVTKTSLLRLQAVTDLRLCADRNRGGQDRAPRAESPVLDQTACPTRPGPRCASTTTTTRPPRSSPWSP